MCFVVVTLTVSITGIQYIIDLKMNKFYQKTNIIVPTYHIIVLSRTIMNVY